MIRQRKFVAASLAWVALHVSGELHAQARGPALDEWRGTAQAAVDPVAVRIDMDAWLKRLMGKFRYEGIGKGINNPEWYHITGFSDCTGIGEGPGVQCIINMTVSEPGLHTAMSLYGMDPAALKIRYMQVRYAGLPEGGDAALKSAGIVKFVLPCVNWPPACRRVIVIKANVDGAPVDVTEEQWGNYFSDLEPGGILTYTLHRIDEIPADRPDLKQH